MKSLRLSSNAVAVLTFLLVVLVFPSMAPALDLVLDARPGTLLISRHADLKAKGPDTFSSAPENLTVIEEAGTLNTLPNIRLGAGVDSTDWYVNGAGLVGYLVNSRYDCFFYGADVAGEYKYKKNVNVGPHLSFVEFQAPQWSGQADVTFSDSYAFIPGVQFSVGYDVQFVFSVD